MCFFWAKGRMYGHPLVSAAAAKRYKKAKVVSGESK
jgi:hypothetical protein